MIISNYDFEYLNPQRAAAVGYMHFPDHRDPGTNQPPAATGFHVISGQSAPAFGKQIP